MLAILAVHPRLSREDGMYGLWTGLNNSTKSRSLNSFITPVIPSLELTVLKGP